MNPILIATTNQDKLREFIQLVPRQKFTILSSKDLPVTKNLTVVETGSTFKQNAIIKAKAYSQASGLLTLSEDSGLQVKALNGQPGVFSARFGPTPQARNLKLLNILKNFSDRSAKYKSVIAICNPQGKLLTTFSAVTQGQILKKPTGSNGFGYDPISFPSS